MTLGVSQDDPALGLGDPAGDDLDRYMRNVPAFPQSGERGRILIAAQKHTGFADFAAQTAADAKQIVRGLLSNAGVQAIFVTQARMLEKRDAANAIAFSSVWIDLSL